MEIRIKKEDLVKCVYLTQSIVERKTTMPILANMLLSANEGIFKASATDLEVTAVSCVEADVKSAGSTTVSARIFSEVVRELPDGEITLKLSEGERLEIHSGRTKLRVVGVSSEEYPSLPGMNTSVKGKVPANQLLEMVSKTIYAVSTDETRFNLNGVCFSMIEEGGSKQLKMVATDGHRLGMIVRPVEGLDFEGDVIVPRKGLAEIKKVLEDQGDNTVGVDIVDGFFILDSGSTKVSIRLIDGEFPDYRQVIPKEEGVLLKFDGSEMSQALKRVALMVTDKGKCVKFDLTEGSARISSSSPELGEANDEMPVEYSGDPISIGFNARYIQDVISAMGENQKVCASIGGALAPGKFFSESDQSAYSIVMPMRLTQ